MSYCLGKLKNITSIIQRNFKAAHNMTAVQQDKINEQNTVNLHQ